MCPILPCKNILFLGFMLHIIHSSLFFWPATHGCATSSLTTVLFSTSCCWTSTITEHELVAVSRFFSSLRFFDSSNSERLLSEHCRFLLFVETSSGTLPDVAVDVGDVRCGGTTIFSSWSEGNSWLEPKPESWDRPFRQDCKDSNLTGFCSFVRGFRCFRGRGGNKLLRTY